MKDIFPKRIPIRDDVLEKVKKYLDRDPALSKEFARELRKLEERLAIQDVLLSRLKTRLDRYEELQKKYKRELELELTRKKIEKSKTQVYNLFFRRPYKLKVLSTFLDENKPFYVTIVEKDKKGKPVVNHEICPYFAGIRLEKEEGSYWTMYFLLSQAPNSKEARLSPPICYLDTMEAFTPIRTHLLDLGALGLNIRLDGKPVPPSIIYKPDISLKSFKEKDREVIEARLEVFNKADNKEKVKILLSVYEQLIKMRNKYEDLQEKYDAVCQDLAEIRSMAKALIKRGDIRQALFEKLIEEAGRADYESIKAKTTIATQTYVNMALREMLERLAEKFEEIKRISVQEAKSPTEYFDKALSVMAAEIDKLKKEEEATATSTEK
ncbi:MAG TPA: hypothetical protein ENG63_04110 [Candidatus Desulfofervidus auxilii]|uniref:Uncharacterized protein n=1 Tax=Desulfofervidus auxilii TaxID=1621989 RepID=A0A7C0Y6T4_DESA2|nr:hypothetical protein [Candidatus Desulfofervidus auxilii]